MDKTSETKKYIAKVGRRKTSIARVRLYKGKEISSIFKDDKTSVDLDKYYLSVRDQRKALKPLDILGLKDEYYFTAKLSGGGKTGQLEALSLGIARCLIVVSEEYIKILRKEGLLSRDSRMVERKKVYHVKARKSPQYSKR